MDNRAYKKSIIREIKSSKARFISILAIIFLGVALYSGIKSSGPDLEKSISVFFSDQNLMDSKIVSSLGLNENDLKLLENNDKILDYFATRSIDVNLTNENDVVKFMEYNKSDKINKLVVTEGRLPKSSGEIALDEKALDSNKNVKIGDNYTIKCDEESEEYFNEKTFKIVGFVKSPMYIDNMSRGITNVGKGTIDYLAILNSSDLSMDVYTEIYVRFKNVENLSAYSDEYDDKMEGNNKYLEELYSKRKVERIKEIKLDAQKEINKAYKEIEDGEKKLNNAQKEIDQGKKKLLEGKKEYELALSKFSQEIKNGEQELIEGEKALDEGEKELNNQKETFLSGGKQLNLAKEKLDKAKKEFLDQGINPTKNTTEYKKQINSLNMLLTTYNGLSSDIKSTVNKLKENEEIPSRKIQSWKNIISNGDLGLSQLTRLINNLEENPKNISLALNISKSIESASENLNKNKTNLERLVSGIIQYQQGVETYEREVKNFNEGKKQLEEAEKELEKGKTDLEKGKKIGQLELDKAIKQIEQSEQKLLDGQKEIQTNRKDLEEGKKEIEKEKEKLNDLDSSEYYFSDRSDNPGFSTYRGSIESLDKIASVFPVFFFLVAALICLTTMTRMVEENRIEIGTLKALGYKDLEIARKFIIYSLLASMAGCILGIVVGSSVLPYIISEAYSSSFALPPVKIHYYSSYIIQSVVVSIVCTVGASLIVLKEELRENPSNLMRTKAPKLGKRILLERIAPLWKRFSFNQKVTFRNLFRYKQRMLMTIFGIAGCMAMLVAGLALEKSTSSIMDIQFGQLIKYDALIVFNDNSSKNENKEYDESLQSLKGYESSLNIYQESVTFKKQNMNKQSAFMYVPENPTDLNKYISLNDRESKSNYKLSDKGVIINEKLAKLLNASVGDEIILTDSNNKDYKVKVDNIIENYANHYIYLSPVYYKKIFKSEVKYNSQLLNFNSSMEDEEKIATTLMDNDKVINVTLTSTMKTLSESSDLGLVMVVIIVASGSLAFVVLYNLININISERIREISTIKVLGFYDNEVAMYIFRENIILTILGIFTGGFMGKILYIFLVSVAELDTMMMIPSVYISSYVIAGLITMFFAILVMIMMYIKLKNINMIDALKSIE